MSATEAAGLTVNPGTFTIHDDRRVGRRPDRQEQAVRVRRLEKQDDTRPLTTFTSNPGGAPVGGNTTRVNASGSQPRSARISRTNFNYDTGPFDNIPKKTPGKPWMLKGDYNINSANKVTFRYNQLDSSSDVPPERIGGARHEPADQHDAVPELRQLRTTRFSRTSSRASASGTRCSARMTNNLLVGYTKQDESRGADQPASRSSSSAPAMAAP